MTTLVLEPFGGLAGDMLLAALLDLGDPRFTLADLEVLAEGLVPGEARLAVTRVRRGGLEATHLAVTTPESAAPPHRHLSDLRALLERCTLGDGVLGDGVLGAGVLGAGVRARAEDALRRLAEAEASVHGTTVEAVHFHEVGAVDTLIDVAGAALALERLGVTCVLATPPLLGEGEVRCAHGEMPVPAPAVAELLRGRPTTRGGGMERTTPTGAAMLAAWTAELAPGTVLRGGTLGYGAGTADPEVGPPNLLRVQLAAEVAPSRVEAWQLEVNLDDMTPEEVGHAVGALRDAGALEVWTVPAQMKKDRPGVVVTALCRAEARAALEDVLFRWTTTLGVRWTRLERAEAPRRMLEVEVDGQPIRVKVRGDEPGPADHAPEHDDVASAAEVLGLPLREVRRRAIAAALGR